MGISTSSNNATYVSPKLNRIKAIEVELSTKNSQFKDEPSYETDDLGRITHYIDGDIDITYTYEYDNSDIKKAFQVPDMCEVNVMAEIVVKGHTIKIYGTDEIDIEKLIELSNTFSNYNEQVFEYIDKYFTGIIIGSLTQCSDLRYQSNNSRSYEAYSYGIPGHFHVYTDAVRFGPDIQLHEMGHFVMSAMDMENKWDQQKVGQLCDKYESWLCQNETSSYKRETHNPSEFFADASSNYFLETEKMKKEAPDLYEYLDSIYGGK